MVYLVVLISNSKPTLLPINLLPKGDCGESAMMFVPSIVILGKAKLRYR